ncbi:MAG: hypothetical protein IKM84_00535 [Oscillospiraceae bacterium]|nr:hypothetical protein [Oscillospiraceae bacterium]
MIQNNRVLVIKFSPIKALSSSMLRTLAVVKGLLTKGYTVDMLTLQTSATHVINEQEYDFLKEVHLVYANPNRAYNAIVSGAKSGVKQKVVGLLRRLFHAFSFYDYTGSIAKKVKLSLLPSSEYEYVIAVSDPKTTHIAARNLIQQGLQYNKLIQYWGDPMFGDITLKSIYPGFVYKMLERRMLGMADKIVYTSPFTLEEAQRLYPNYRERMSYTPTAYLEEKNFPPHGGRYTVGYYGDYPARVRNIMPLYEACEEMQDKLNLNIVGNTDFELAETDTIKIYPRGNISAFEVRTDLLVCILNKSGTQIPGKLYHYAAYNKPVLVIEDGERADDMHKFIQSFGRYYTCRNKKEEIIQRITEIMNHNETWTPCDQMSPNRVTERILEGL